MHAHVQAAAVWLLAPYDSASKDITALLRLLCGFKTADTFRWALKIELHPADTGEQRSIRKMNVPGLFGYCLKQRFTSSIFRCAKEQRLLCVSCDDWPSAGVPSRSYIYSRLSMCCMVFAGCIDIWWHSELRQTNTDACAHCRCLRHNLSDEEFESFTQAYDLYRKSLTANRTPLHVTTLPELAMNWSRGFSAKYHVHVDTATRLLLQTGQYWLHSSLAKSNGAFDPVKLDMCASVTGKQLLDSHPPGCAGPDAALSIAHCERAVA